MPATAVVPLLAYAALAVGALPRLGRVPTHALFGLGGVALVLLLLGLRSAWDLATYMAVQRGPRR